MSRGRIFADMTTPSSPFPHVDRVVYRRNPLNQVVCQVRFPPVLRLQAQTPFEFQEALKSDFPIYGEPDSGLELPPQLMQLVGGLKRSEVHRFQSENARWTISIATNFIALTCESYQSWQEFSGHLFNSLGEFCRIYEPSFYNRIGLRYQNIIRREWVGEDASWSKFINPSLVGPIADRQLEELLLDASSSLRIKLNNGTDTVHLQHGLAELEAAEQRCYILDFDYYTDEKTEIGNAENVINRLYGYSGPAFQWAITKPLHEAMGPT